MLGIALIFGILYALARRLIDVNLYSLTAFDSDLLTRFYLGASRPATAWQERWAQPRDQRAGAGTPSLSERAGEPWLSSRNPDPLTGLDVNDGLDLHDLLIGRKEDDERVYWGPHLLLNTTAVVAARGTSTRSALKAESFVLSPLYCGSRSVGFARTPNSKPAGGARASLSLGRALAISGASAGACVGLLWPNPLSAMLTLLSARPGWWIEKPKPDGWAAASPRFGDLPVTTSFGLTGVSNEFVYLSDGGEFEGLGVYELIRRRCRYIVAVDGGSARASADAGLANLIQRCRVDFGIRVEIDTQPLQQIGPDGPSSAHFAVGQIHYGDVDEGETPGVLVYTRASITGDEPTDVQQCARSETHSPHRAGDFRHAIDDRQFECYRCLGYHVSRAIFGEAAVRLGKHDGEPAREPHGEYIRRLFAAVSERWDLPERAEGEPTAASTRVSSDGTDCR